MPCEDHLGGVCLGREAGAQSLDDSAGAEVAAPDADADDVVAVLLERASGSLDSFEVLLADLTGELDPSEEVVAEACARMQGCLIGFALLRPAVDGVLGYEGIDPREVEL